jgi:phage terminase large subunit-like protein
MKSEQNTVGSPTPRLQTKQLSNLQSRVNEVNEFAKAVGVDLMPWQIHALTEMLRVNPDGTFARRTHGILVARQNGKSALMRIRLLAGMFLWGEVWLSMAQNRALALEHFTEAMKLVDENEWLRNEVKRLSRTNGKEFVELTNGGKWSVVAATRDGARGFTGNLWVDEIRDVTHDAWKAATPVTRAVKNAQIVFTSNAGDAHSEILNDLRNRALSGHAKSMNFLEWSADPELDVMDRQAWLQANPAIGHTIEENVIAEAALTDTPEMFRTESLCLWVENMQSAWTLGSYQKCVDKSLRLSSDKPTYLAFDVTPDRKRADLVGVQILENGTMAFGIMQSWESSSSVDDMVIARDVSKWAAKYQTELIAYDKWTGAAIAQRLSVGGYPMRDTSGGLFAQACDEMLSAMNAQRIVHNGDETLEKHFMACARKPTDNGGWRIVRRSSSAPISAACAAVMALHHANKPQAEALIMFA